MNIKEIKEMIALMNENGLLELEIEKDGLRIRLKKKSAAHIASDEPVFIEEETVGQGKPRLKDNSSSEKMLSKTIEIKAPMVGTFYRSPSPDSPPYADVGQVVEVGQVICIIEAMKLMNEIKSEIKGKILEILVDNTEPVEFGQPMFLIEPL